MIVNPVHPVSIVKKRRGSKGLIRKESMKSSVQARWKRRILLIEAHQIGRSLGLESRSLLLEAASSRGVRVLFSGKYQDDVSPPVAKRHSVRERILSRSPTYVNP